MKNKRKYENTAPNTANEISKKNLKKLKKLTKPENPVVKDIKSKATDFLSDRKNANCLIDILSYLDNTEPGSVVSAAIQAVKRIFVAALEKGQIKNPADKETKLLLNPTQLLLQPTQLLLQPTQLLLQPTQLLLQPTGKEETSVSEAENQYSIWLWERFGEGTRRLCEMVHHKKTSVAHLAVATVLNIIQCNNWANSKTKSKDWDSEDLKLLQSLVLVLCSTRVSNRIGLTRFQEYLEYSDVSYHFLSLLSRLVTKVAKTEKANFVFVDNVITCLEMFDMPAKEKFLNCPLFLSGASEGQRPNYDDLRKHFGAVWVSVLSCKFNLDLYKRALIMLNEKVIPLLPRPLLLTDFLLSSFAVGGAISMLALSGVFTLVTKYNLEYPDFYTKLYELFTLEIFFVKYKARFFHLSDVFLSSTHLPEALVAAFLKRLARIALQAPAESLPMCLRFIHNLIHRHRGLVSLLDSPTRQDLTSDPFLPEEKDPLKSRAMESSLWEVKTLASHILPEVSSVARDLVDKGLKETEKDFSGLLETSPASLMEIELKKKVFVNVAINWESPQGFKLPNHDFFTDLFEIA